MGGMYCKKNKSIGMKEQVKAKVAIIIPAYNAAQTLPRTLDSLLAQTLKDIEIWVVDDGSKDDTLQVIEDYARNDYRIHPLHKKNGGAYSARRAAISKINAEFVGFVDADDTIEPTMYEDMYQFASTYKLDAARCDTDDDSKIGNQPEIFLTKEEVYKNVLYPLLVEGIGAASVWDHIYKVPSEGFVLHNSNIMMSDDMMINLQFLRNVTRYGHLHKGLYHYLVNDGSSVRNYRYKSVEDFQEIINYREEVLPIWYNVEADSMVQAQWVVKNAFNNFISACTARAENFSIRMTSVNGLLNIRQVKASVLRLWRLGYRNPAVRVLMLSYCGFRLPIVFLLLLKRRLLQR